jgi:hypothetical protein
MEQTTAQAASDLAGTAAGLKGSGLAAILGAVAMKFIDKIPFGQWFKKTPRTKAEPKGVDTTTVENLLLHHKEDCLECIDEKIDAKIKAHAAIDAEWRKQDIEERRAFRTEVVDGIRGVHKRFDDYLSLQIKHQQQVKP